MALWAALDLTLPATGSQPGNRCGGCPVRQSLGVDLHTARPGNELEVARVHVASWREAYAGLLPASYLDGLEPASRAANYTFGTDDPVTVLAVDEDRTCGFATTGAARDDDVVGCGELMALYVDPAWLGRGVGRTLMADARVRLGARRFAEALLWVLVGNERAMRFYERDGWRSDGSQRRERVHGVMVEEVRYRRRLDV